MIRNTYIVYIDTDKSKAYLQDCLNSCARFPNINPIPHEGLLGHDVTRLCDELGVPTIDMYRNEQNPDMRREQSAAFSDQAAHYAIWQKIVEDGESGAIFEHDAIVKYDYSSMQPCDGEILWLGPRIDQENDYTPPIDCEWVRVSIDRFEGTHAYAITPVTAQMLIDNFRKYGFNDSLDGQLGMRNMFDLDMTTIDPPPVVAVIGGGRQSSIAAQGASGSWNAYHTEGFLKNIRPGCNVPPIRKLHYSDLSFNALIPDIEQVLWGARKLDGREQSVLVYAGHEGLSSVWLSNKLLQHDDSYMQIVSQFKNDNEARLCAFNTYFSKYYYKLNIVPIGQDSALLEQAVKDSDIRFDVIFYDGDMSSRDVLYDGIHLWNLLKSEGVLIFTGINSAVENIIDAVSATVVYKDNIVALKKNHQWIKQ